MELDTIIKAIKEKILSIRGKGSVVISGKQTITLSKGGAIIVDSYNSETIFKDFHIVGLNGKSKQEILELVSKWIDKTK